MLKNRKVFLSGPMEYAPDGGADWRTIAEARFTQAGFRVFNPCNISEEVLKPHGLDVPKYNELKKTIDTNILDFAAYWSATQDIINVDLNELRTSDLVLAKVSKIASGGTSGELTLARHLGIPIVAFCEDPIDTVSGWVIGLSEHLFTAGWCIESPPLERAMQFALKELEK